MRSPGINHLFMSGRCIVRLQGCLSRPSWIYCLVMLAVSGLIEGEPHWSCTANRGGEPVHRSSRSARASLATGSPMVEPLRINPRYHGFCNALLLCVVVSCGVGCYSYALLPEDPPGVRRSKIAKRVAVDIVTLGFAE